MDLSIRDWMVVIGVLLILAVLLDGYRRMRKTHGAKIRMSLKTVPTGSEEDMTRGELPNGGARLASRGQARKASVPKEPTFIEELSAVSVALSREAPMPAEQAVAETGMPAQPVADQQQTAAEFDSTEVPSDRMAEGISSSYEQQEDLTWSTGEQELPELSPHADTLSAKPAAEPAREIIVVNAISKDPQGFNGEELLHILLTCDLRFGKMNIFHRYEKSNGKGAIQFSVANAVEPGTFDLNNMRKFRTPGICLFMQLPGAQDAQKALEYMVETAHCIARNLNGELRDENRSALTAQTVEHYRSRIREFDRKRMAKHA
jgi:cell division protein ZipA